jgi:hypothetical protein
MPWRKCSVVEEHLRFVQDLTCDALIANYVAKASGFAWFPQVPHAAFSSSQDSELPRRKFSGCNAASHATKIDS